MARLEAMHIGARMVFTQRTSSDDDLDNTLNPRSLTHFISLYHFHCKYVMPLELVSERMRTCVHEGLG